MKPNPTLYEISSDVLALEALLYEMGGDVTDAEIEEQFDKWFASLQEDRDRKIDAYCRLYYEFEARAKVRRDEIKRLEAGAKVCENAADRLKKRLKWFLDTHKLTKLDTGLSVLTVAKNGGKLPLLLPDLWKKEPTVAPKRFQQTIVQLDAECVREVVEAMGTLCPDCGNALTVGPVKAEGEPQQIDCPICLWKGLPNEMVRFGERGTHLRIK